MAPTTDLPDDVQAETRRRRRRWLALLGALLVLAVLLTTQHAEEVGRLLAGAAVIWSVIGLAWVAGPARDFRKTEARIRAEEYIRGRQE
ncbi:hypothetical protein [Actinomadura verrucosospora]|uniref:Uncharacterized protein n=1 Tax=Actinomadura verrucosospora TaxID=46165 RepID=A0A7D3ZVI5_ACTVE|nr:hypothetical protein [Actinomadura verrucosospora]QKG19966.1 hypothetical protein ACTIVE_1602 [Actinomadura verrucosospora]